MSTTPTLSSALTKERFRSLSEGDLIQDASGDTWTARKIEPIERDSNFPGPLKAYVQRSDGKELVLLWDDENGIVIDQDFRSVPEFN